jgi:hypothetical protein
MVKPGKAEQAAARGERLAAALRENLKRRKQQARGRAAEGPPENTAPAAIDPIAGNPDFRRNPGPKSGGESGNAGR